MFTIFCNRERKENLLGLSGILTPDKTNFIFTAEELKDSESVLRNYVDPIFIEVTSNWKELNCDNGIELGKWLRREFYLSAAIIFVSSRELNDFSEKHRAFLQAKGSYLISWQVAPDLVNLQLQNLRNPSESEVIDVVVEHCDILEKWKKLSHDFRYAIQNYENEYGEAGKIFVQWAESVEIFAPSQRENLSVLSRILEAPPNKVNLNELKNAYKKLKIGLELISNTDARTEKNAVRIYEFTQENKPPEYYSKILIANDRKDILLPDLLRKNYGYNVLKLATNRSDAERLFQSEKPEVVLADYYFKTSEEGMRFIKFASDKKHNWAPLVLVNSYDNLLNIDFPDGVINCSGEEAHNHKFIHTVIWKAAMDDANEVGNEQRADLPAGISSAEDDCRRLLSSTILPALRFGIVRWQAFLTEVLKPSLELLRKLSKLKPTADETSVIDKLKEVLEPFEFDKEFSFFSISNLIRMIRVLHDKIDELADSQISKDLHFIGHTFLGSSLNEIDLAINELQEVSDKLKDLADYEKVIVEIENLCCKYKKESFGLEDARNLLNKTETVFRLLPEIAFDIDSNVESLQLQIRLLIVEDDINWREEFVIPIVEEVKSELASAGYLIDYESFDNAEDAVNSAPVVNKTRILNVNDNVPPKTLAIVDLYLPENNPKTKSQTLSNNAPFPSTPRKEIGLNLIREFRSPSRNIRVIVLSTSGSDNDRRDIQRLGVSKKDHIIKGFIKKKELKDAIIRNITRNDIHVVEQLEEEKTRFLIDGIDIKIDPSETEIFKAILKLSTEKPGFTARDILNLLPRRIDEGLIKRLISSLRKKIQISLALHGIFVDKEDIIATIPNFDGRKAAYRLLGIIKTGKDKNPISEDAYPYDEDGNLLPPRAFKILVIENDLPASDYITSNLKTISGVIIEQATNVEEGVKKAADFQPDLISLDLDIPRSIKDFETNPKLGDKNAGLDALEIIRLNLSSVKVVLNSIYYNDRELRDRAGQLAISNENVIPKLARNDWINLLIQRVKELKAETLQGKKSHILPKVPEPLIEILDGCNLKQGILKLKINGNFYQPKTNSERAKILGLLLKNAHALVTYNRIQKYFKFPEITDNNRKTWASRIRTDIREKWLKLNASQFPGCENSILTNQPEIGMTLNVHVLNPKKLK